jgi:transcriptional antiterminator RfaH
METNSSPSAEPSLKQGEKAWYCIRTHLKHEHIATAHLRQIPDVTVFNPQLRVLRPTRRGRIWSTESLFPNYVFGCFALASKLEKIVHTPAVKLVVRFGDQTPTIPEAVIEELHQDLTELSSKVLVDVPAEGEEVEIADGAFAGVKGSVTRILPGKQRAQILLEVMGRSVQAEFSLDLLLFNQRRAAQFALPPVEIGLAHRTGCHNLALMPV